MKIRIGTRKSPLAMAQSEWVADLIRRSGSEVELVGIVTEGDQPAATWPVGKGVFVKAIDEALLDRRIDLAVHSAKDVPAVLTAGLDVACIPIREDPADILISRAGWSLDTLPKSARLGTSSLRRIAQLKFFRADVMTVNIRGNVETRLCKIGDADECDAVILAAAGINRLGAGRVLERLGLRSARLDPAEFLPAPGQGTLMILSRADETNRFSSLSHAASRAAIDLERAFVKHLSADCNWPLGAWAQPNGNGFRFTAAMYSIDGKLRALETEEQITDKSGAKDLADRVLKKGGQRILAWNRDLENK